jgi:hypothetical protein
MKISKCLGKHVLLCSGKSLNVFTAYMEITRIIVIHIFLRDPYLDAG